MWSLTERDNRILAELSGESRDIALRRALEETARDHLIGLLLHEDYERVIQWYTHDVTMVLGLDTTLDGEILKGHEEIIQHFVNIQQQTEIVHVPVLTIADRGRISAYTETCYKWLGKNGKADYDFSGALNKEPVEAPFVGWPEVVYGEVLKVREVVVFDLNEQMKVKRVEWRQLGMEHLGDASLDAMALQSEKLKVIMGSRNQHELFQVFADELTGDSRDRPLRYELENKISTFFDDINEKRWAIVKSYFSEDARVIFGLNNPNLIVDKDVDKVITRTREKGYGMRRVTVPTLVLVNRGRITCFLTNVWIETDEKDDDETLDIAEEDARFGEHHEVAIIDLDDEYKFKRVEFRTHSVMSAGYSQTFDRYAAEMAGSSRDLSMRPAIEELVRKFFRDCDNNRLSEIMELLSDNPAIVYFLYMPGFIHHGMDEALEAFTSWCSDDTVTRTVLQTIVVDRGRVTCHTISFSIAAENGDFVHEAHQIAILDLDATYRIERLEYRETNRADKTHEGGRELFDALVKEAEKNAIAVE
ncbi:hypothetical protein CKAH01_14893 [Colletotrichum kahawae]|uniref:Uncharacterized protein n=1 Tax=Colletotrichum kahawae TaxID=34407 RepID=A0AAE0D8X0_COLKA|nr:hypothetical protein CKAH01_14893 [Colletotrichum kahawae]